MKLTDEWGPSSPTGAAYQSRRARGHYKNLSEESFDLLKSAGHIIHTVNGQMLFQEGEPQNNIFVVLDGKVKVGKRAHAPVWMDMGPYGVIDVEEETKPGWEMARIYSQVACLGMPDCTLGDCHALAASSEGECDLLMVNVKSLKKALQAHPVQADRVLEDLRRLMI